MEDEALLHEVNSILRTVPNKGTILSDLPENHSWFGRIGAVMDKMGPIYSTQLMIAMDGLNSASPRAYSSSYRRLMVLLHKARSALTLKTSGPVSTLTASGQVFDYFDEIRKIIELATNDILFVDPYLDAEFVSKYLPFIREGVFIRLLSGTNKLSTLTPAVKIYAQQVKNSIELRTSSFHDRFIFVDKASCYQSGASFKDGAKNAPVTITQITDAFDSMLKTYERLWDEGDTKI